MSGGIAPTSSGRITWCVPLLAALAVLPLGSRSAPAAYALALAVLLVFVLSVNERSGQQSALEETTRWLRTEPILWVFALPAYALFQLLILGTSDLLSGPIDATGRFIAITSALGFLYLLVRRSVQTHRDVRILLVGLAIVGSTEALYGLLNLLAGNEYILLWRREKFFSSATGTLASRNHFAYLMELILPAILALHVVVTRRGTRPGTTMSDYQARRTLTLTAATICGMALLFSQSRMGLISFGSACGLIGVCARFSSPNRGRSNATARTQWMLPVLVATFFIGLIVAALGLDSVLERFWHIDRDFATGRLPLWQATVQMFTESPILGKGWGSFEALLPSYRSDPDGYFSTHAHNEYLESLAEGGLIGFALVAVLVFFFIRRLATVLRAAPSRSQRNVLLLLATGIVSVLFHSVADYGLRIPGVAVVFVTTTALFSRLSENPELISRRQRRTVAQRRPHR